MLYKVNTQFLKYSTEESIATLVGELESQKDEIVTLDLSLNAYSPEIFRIICGKIKSLSNLKSIVLESILDSLTFEEMCEVMDALGESLPSNLESLALPSNALSCNFPAKFANFISTCPLKVLNLHNCGLGEDGLKRVVACLDKVENKANLVSLNLSKNRINVICPDFSTVLNKFENVSTLVLNANTIEEKSMALFLKELEPKELEILNLTDNFVCGEAIDALGDLFVRSDLKELYLQDIKVDEGDINRLLKKMNTKSFATLPGSFSDSRPSLVLDISCNSFDQECISLLQELLSLFTFKRLVIFDNSYEDCEELKQEVAATNGRVVEDEDEEEFEPLDEEIVEKLARL